MWFDSITFGDVLTIVIVGLTGLIAYFSWQRVVEHRFTALEKSFDVQFSALAMQINTIMMRDVGSLQSRVTALEHDSTDMHKRVHLMANDLNGIGLKVDRLERPIA